MSTTDEVTILMVCHNHYDLSNVQIVNNSWQYVTGFDKTSLHTHTHTQQQDALFTNG